MSPARRSSWIGFFVPSICGPKCMGSLETSGSARTTPRFSRCSPAGGCLGAPPLPPPGLPRRGQ
eukprot:12825324-Prorocentrum_lima.AAC.1